MKAKSLIFIAFVLVAALVMSASVQQTAEQLYQSGLYKEEVEGDLASAIEIFQQILKSFPDNREIAAKAQLQIGLCYEKLGLGEAEKAFRTVVDSYPEQMEAVKVAQEKLALILRSRALLETGDEELSIRQVWTGPTDVSGLGDVSPDGKFLSFVDWTTGDLAIRDLAAGENRRLTDKGSWMQSPEMALFSKWSRDTRQIAYSWINKDKGVELHVIDVDKPQPRSLYLKANAYVQPLDWTPDGKFILALFTGGIEDRRIGDKPGESVQIGLVSAEDGEVRFFKNFEIGVNQAPWSFTFSPDGRYIAFDSPQKNAVTNRDIFLLTADGSQEIPLVNHPALDYVLGWTPDGKGLVFASERTGSRSVWIVDVVDGKPQGDPRLLKQDIGPVNSMGITRQGALFYGISSDISDVYVTRLDPSTGRLLAPVKKAVSHYEGRNSYPAYSADGMFLAYMSFRNSLTMAGRPNPDVLCIKTLETGQIQELSLDLASYGYPRWSPDGRSISVEGTDWEGRPGIYRVEIQTGDVIPFIRGENGSVFYSHRWSKDGESIIYTYGDDTLREAESGSERASHIFSYDIETEEIKKLPGSPADAMDIDISPDSEWLALLNRGKERVLRIMPASGGDPREIYRFETNEDEGAVISPAWIAEGGYILFSKIRQDREGMWDLYAIARDGGEPRKIDLSMCQFRHFSLHPDGQDIVFSSKGLSPSSRNAEIWVMENFLPKDKSRENP